MEIPTTTNGWTFTDDEIGHLPKFPIKCRICDTAMFMRHSSVGHKEGWDVAVNQICYKCPVCDWFITFEVRRPIEEIDAILEHRGGKQRLVPLDMWLTHEEEELIREKLESLGYGQWTDSL